LLARVLAGFNTPETILTRVAVAEFAVTVKDSPGPAVKASSQRRVFTPAASRGVTVNVAVSPEAMEAVVADKLKLAGAPPTVQVKVLRTEVELGPVPTVSPERFDQIW
jgi:hypothetical protein